MKLSALFLTIFTSISLISCGSVEESSSSQKTSHYSPTYKNNDLVRDIFKADQEMISTYLGNRINEYDIAVDHYQLSSRQFKYAYKDEICLEKVFPFINYSFTHKKERIVINDSSSNPTPLKVSPNLFLIDIDTCPVFNTISTALARVLDYVPYASSVIRHNNKAYIYQRMFFNEYEEDINNPYGEITTHILKGSHYEELPSSDFVFLENAFTIHISFSDTFEKDWMGGICQTTRDYESYTIEGSSFDEIIYKNFHSEIKIHSKYLSGEHYAYEVKKILGIDIYEEKKDFEHNKLAGIVQHEFCHSLGLADLYKKDDYNQDKIVLDLGESIMYGTTNIGSQLLKQRDINNITALYDGVLYNKLLEVRNTYDPTNKIPLPF